MKLYKYRALNKFTLTNLSLGTVYYPRASELNDPCDAQMRVTKPTEKTLINELAMDLFSEGLVPGVEIDRAHYAGDFESLFHPFADAKIEEFCSRGIYSMSELSDNHLLWSHYADSHRGICIEYEINPDAYSYLGPVRYSDTHEATKFEEIFKRPEEAIRKYYFDKAMAWQYEREWRLLTNRGGTLGAEIFDISAIILGARTSDIDCLTVISLAMSRGISLRKAQVGDDSKDVILQEIDPKPFATACAKRCGIAE